jgi:heterodisulfide reductase subunit A
MFTAKQVALAKHLDPNLLISVFTMDIRAFGKDFEAYFDAVQALPGVSYHRAMPSSVHQLQQSRNLLLSYPDHDGKLIEETFDLLVLATGLAPPQGMQHLAQHLDIQLNDYGFARSNPYLPTRSSKDGIFVAGAFREPKDIPDTVAEAAAAAAEIAAFLHHSSSPHTLSPLPHTRDVSDDEPRLGIFVCDCNGDLAPLDTPQLVASAQTLPGVALAQALPMACSTEGLSTIQAAIEEHDLNRIVVAGCSHRFFSDEFDALMRRAGLDSRLLARANLREQVLLPHRDHASLLPAKASSLIAMTAASLKAMSGLEALSRGTSQPLTRRALVIGGGAAGLSAALQLANLHIPVHLVERQPQLGGQWRHIRYQPDGSDPQLALQELLQQVQAHPNITPHLDAEVTACHGAPGDYRSTISHNDHQETIHHSVLLVATGGAPASTNDYLYGQDPRVLTQRELELQITDGTLATAQTVVMLQCVASREPSRPYCSRVCCTQAVKNALKLKALKPSLNVYVLYREMRTFGFREAYYQDARDAGVVFLRYDLPDKPQVSANPDTLSVSLTEPVTGHNLSLNADLLVLSVGIDPYPATTLAQTLGLSLNNDGFFLEEHPKMKPLDLAKTGFFLAGLAHSPRFLEETIAQAQGAAMRAAAFLAPEALTDQPTAVWVNERLCSFCGLCVEACPFDARVMNYDSRIADVDYALCQGCGVCAMVCPNKATLQKSFEHKQLISAIDMAVI